MGLFIKPYCIILSAAVVIGSLAGLALIKQSNIEYGRDFLLIALVSLVIMVLTILLSIFRRIRTIMLTNPADVIKSE